MKKSILFMIIISFSLYGNSMIINQSSLKHQLIPKLKKGVVYKKFRTVLARKANIGEVIDTYTNDGLETTNTVTKQSYIVKNTTEAKEKYIVNETTFHKKYIFYKKQNKIWSIFKPIGKIKAIKVKNQVPFYIVAPWGEKMIVKPGDFLVSPLDYSEIYRIAKKEFFETYKTN